jgi:O-succinylbenzoate synthase
VGLFERDVSADPWRPSGGLLGVGRAVADPDALADLAAPPDRQQWWRDRLVRCHTVLAEVSPR